jgi:AcrR family transcriptional regulator
LNKLVPIAVRKGRPSTEESKQKLEHVLRVARQHFAHHGYGTTTVRAIAEVANVSTRTIYNQFETKLALFEACMESDSRHYPTHHLDFDMEPHKALHQFVVNLIHHLSTEMNLSLSIILYREGSEFPELLKNALTHEKVQLIQPLAKYLRRYGLEKANSCEHARLFSMLATAEFLRRLNFNLPMLTEAEIQRHASTVTAMFLHGAEIK